MISTWLPVSSVRGVESFTFPHPHTFLLSLLKFLSVFASVFTFVFFPTDLSLFVLKSHYFNYCIFTIFLSGNINFHQNLIFLIFLEFFFIFM